MPIFTKLSQVNGERDNVNLNIDHIIYYIVLIIKRYTKYLSNFWKKINQM